MKLSNDGKLNEILQKAGLFKKTIGREERKRIFGGYDCTPGQATTSHTCDGCCEGFDTANTDCTPHCEP